MSQSRLRLKTKIQADIPPSGAIDLFYDATEGVVKVIDHEGAAVSFSGADGGGSTDALTTSNGSSAAAAGKLGELLSATTFTNSVVDDTSENVCTLELTPGEWDLQATVSWESASATTISRRVQIVDSGLSAVASVYRSWVATTSSLSETDHTKLSRVRVTTTTSYAVRVTAEFSAGSVSVILASLEARRVR